MPIYYDDAPWTERNARTGPSPNASSRPAVDGHPVDGIVRAGYTKAEVASAVT